MRGVHVSDYAILKFVEAEFGIDVDWLRNAIAERARTTAVTGMTRVDHEGLRFHLSGGTVVSVERIGPPR